MIKEGIGDYCAITFVRGRVAALVSRLVIWLPVVYYVLSHQAFSAYLSTVMAFNRSLGDMLDTHRYGNILPTYTRVFLAFCDRLFILITRDDRSIYFADEKIITHIQAVQG